MEDEISDLRSQLASMQEQKYEACRGMEREEERLKAELGAERERAAAAEARLRAAADQLEAAHRERDQLGQQLLTARQQHFQQQLSQQQQQQQQPSSLPPDLTTNSVDLARLRELRRMVKEECDSLLARRELLQQDVVNIAKQLGDGTNGGGGNVSNNNSASSLDASFRFSGGGGAVAVSHEHILGAPDGKSACSKSAPGTSTTMSPSHAFSSLATKAYKVLFPA